MRLYRIFSLSFSMVFLIVGGIFLLIPDKVLVFFNTLSSGTGLEPSPVIGVNFYVALAVAYMYLVSLLAFLMYRHPRNMFFPLLLANAKLASALLSFYILVVHQPSLIYLVNGATDGLIGIVALIFYSKIKKTVQ